MKEKNDNNVGRFKIFVFFFNCFNICTVSLLLQKENHWK